MVEASSSTLGRLLQAGARPVNGGSVAFFRVAFGVAMVINGLWYLRYRVHSYYIEPSFHFPYGPLTFVKPLPGVGMYLVFWAMVGIAGLIAVGLWYRVAAASYFVLTTYVFLIDTTYFQNHDYLISLVAFLLILIPANRQWSFDARKRPEIASSSVPAWVVWLLRFQIGVVYFFGGVAKLNADWLQGEPLRQWLARRTDFPIIGAHFTNETVVWTMTYGALALDLFVVAFLLYAPTRIAAYLVATIFHLVNARLFGIVIFPWVMIAVTTMYFRPDWPRYVAAWMRARSAIVRRLLPANRPPSPVDGAVSVSAAVADPGTAMHGHVGHGRMRPLLACFLLLWASTQVLLPLRHYAIAGSPSWTEEGHRFAWHMKLRAKSGTATFVLTRDGETWTVDPADHLDRKQLARLAGHPERLVHFARYLSDLHDGAEVRAVTQVSLNGRPPAPLVDPTVDLGAKRPFWFGRASWILPLEEPLPGR